MRSGSIIQKESVQFFFPIFFSVWAARIVFVNGFMKFSASEFACGQRGVILWCLTPTSAMYNSNLLLVKGGPLSLRMMIGQWRSQGQAW